MYCLFEYSFIFKDLGNNEIEDMLMARYPYRIG